MAGLWLFVAAGYFLLYAFASVSANLQSTMHFRQIGN